MSLGALSMGLQGFGAVSGAIGTFFDAKSQKLNLETQAALAEVNARLSESSAQQELARGQAEAARLKMQAGRIKAGQVAAQAANGIDIGVGSAAEVRASTDILKEIDANQIEANAVMSAWGYRVQAQNSRNEAGMQRAGAKSISPGMSAAGSLLGSAGQVASSWYKLGY